MKGGSSYLSQNDLRQHFGLGSSNNIDEVTVRWPTGKIEVLKNVPADFIYTVVEGQGIKVKVPLPAVEAVSSAMRTEEGGATINGVKGARP